MSSQIILEDQALAKIYLVEMHPKRACPPMVVVHGSLLADTLYIYICLFSFLLICFLSNHMVTFCSPSFWECQTNGVVFPSTCFCSKPFNCHVLLPDRVLELGSIISGDCTCCWVVRPHAWNIHL